MINEERLMEIIWDLQATNKELEEHVERLEERVNELVFEREHRSSNRY